MPAPPVLGPPTAICTLPAGRFSVEFGWDRAPDALWLKTVRDLMVRSGRETVEATAEQVSITFYPHEADSALEDLAELLADADRDYVLELENRDAAVAFVRETLESRFGVGPDLPVREL